MRRTIRTTTVFIAALFLMAHAQVAKFSGASFVSPLLPAPPRPAECRTLNPALSLQPQIDAVPAGAPACLAPGIYAGPVVVRHPLTLWGSHQATIRFDGVGNTVDVTSDGVHLLGFSLDGSGRRADHNDAALHLQGRGIEIRGIRIRHALFGIVADRSDEIAISGNDIGGVPGTEFGLRGDAIRVWESHHIVIRNNDVHDMRDVLVWYSGQAEVRDNLVVRGRYGTHFMYGVQSEAVGNVYLQNTVGLFSMYSHNLRIHHNLFAGSDDINGMGIGVKESGNLDIESNRFLSDTVGLYLDNSPEQVNEWLSANRNVFGLCTVGIRFLGNPVHSHFWDNDFQSNQTQVQVQGGGGTASADWRRNFFDDYRGYDLDHNGTGDVPYRMESYAEELTSNFPEVAFFRQTPAFALIDALGHLFPLFAPATVLVDPTPRMAPASPPEVGYGR